MTKRPIAFLLVCLMAWTLAFTVCEPVLARSSGFGYGPQQYKSGYAYGNGIYFAPYDFTVYEQPDVSSALIGQFHWSRRTQTNAIQMTNASGNPQSVYADHVFFCFYPELDVAMMAVTGDSEDGDWIEVIYDQSKKRTGWINLKRPSAEKLEMASAEKPKHFGVYQTWQDFMKLNAKTSGIYWLSGVTEYQRSVRQSDADEAKFIPVTVIRQLKVKHIRGNWLLVQVVDFERNTPIGWVRWRDEDGNLLVFPNISGQNMPIVTTAY
jgi:hypothetical protein